MERSTLLTVEEVAGIFRLSKMTVYRMIKKGDLVAIHLSERAIRVPESEIDLYFKGDK